jgi:predicted nucleic acid-binding Zn ribbon protein
VFKREVYSIGDLVLRQLRSQGLETPLLQRRLIDSWPEVAGAAVARYTTDVSIYNQTLFVRLSVPALRADLSMVKGELIKKLNAHVGAQLISDIRFC